MPVPIRETKFILENLGQDELSEWLQAFDEQQVKKMRTITMCGWATCLDSELYYNLAEGRCTREHSLQRWMSTWT